MKTKLPLLLSALLTLCLAAPAFAGGNGENGGDGVIINGKMYSLDLAEQGLDQSPWVGDTDMLSATLAQKVKDFFGADVSNSTMSIVLRKLGRFEKHIDPVYTKALFSVFDSYNVIFVRVPLQKVNDADSIVPFQDIYQIGLHDQTTIRINQFAYSNMDDSNQAAFLLHEIIYASETTELTSKNARALDAFLFNPKYKLNSAQNLAEMLVKLDFDSYANFADVNRYGHIDLQWYILGAIGQTPVIWQNASPLTAGDQALLMNMKSAWGPILKTDNYAANAELYIKNSKFMPVTFGWENQDVSSFEPGQSWNTGGGFFSSNIPDPTGVFTTTSNSVVGTYSGVSANNFKIEIKKLGDTGVTGFSSGVYTFVAKMTWTGGQSNQDETAYAILMANQ